MTNLNVVALITALAIILLGASAPANAQTAGDFEFADELNACVAALNDEIDLSDVQRIRHIVTDYNLKGRGYSLTITTRTFSATEEKQYSAICVATGNNQPSQLKIEQKNT